jgi:hypothetical protein
MRTAESRILQDSRKLSRISVQVACRYISDEKEYESLMLDLSQGGALLSSVFLPHEEEFPVQDNKISITIEDENNLKAPLKLDGTIRRSNIGMSEFGKVVQFGIEFENTPLALLRFISALSKPRPKAQDTIAHKKLEVVSFD